MDAPGPGVAVLTETYYLNDFEVTVNGRPAACFRVNHAFRGVALPAVGTYTISYRYWPRYFTASLWASLLGLVALAGGALWLWHQPSLPAGRAISTP